MGRKNQPVYANIMMADVTPPSAAAAVATNPAPYKDVEMAHKVLGKDMTELVSALKLDERCSNTTLDNEYRK
ncbi:hypothetical protein DAPPUDRAFT_320682 [Daphnia pulex]|uniref:Focal AT domain-containing protein n=1 Tax=Daphnia pulex TaxID=6669 RepID=E9GQV9_DAPPU|nr:hypothetical protein DAPPUDRAFT_336105 [Daphnia pulex]EFX78260.1 hypothetical protein DAPPUDRAFT_320682 [Daphnia pulex]|eukprot:EFX62975.1 hypothetical protein DAPPUDRAFT_336105 [Daphnia pulex]